MPGWLQSPSRAFDSAPAVKGRTRANSLVRLLSLVCPASVPDRHVVSIGRLRCLVLMQKVEVIKSAFWQRQPCWLSKARILQSITLLEGWMAQSNAVGYLLKTYTLVAENVTFK